MSKVCIVSGTARGIGAAIANRMAEADYVVIGVDIAYPSNQGVSALPGAPATAGLHRVHCDIGDRDQVQELVAAVRQRLGGPHVVVNNAAWIHYAALQDVDEPTFDRMISIGIKGTLWLSQSAAIAMGEDGGGSIINITSGAATVGIPRASMYGAIKGACASLTRHMAVELAKDGIRVNAVAPGFVPTPGSLAAVDAAGVALRESGTPLRLAAPEDIANSVAFLASDEAAAITGQSISIDGGHSIGF